jgi:two-component system sensor histidine kinase PilS (NtrC family)
MLAFRLILAVVGIVLVGLLAAGLAAYVVLLIACALDLAYFMVVPRVQDLRRFAAIQLAADGLIVTALVYLTGGVGSFATILYFASILAGCLIVSPRFGIACASASTALLALTGAAYVAAAHLKTTLPLLPATFVPLLGARAATVAAYVIVHGLAFHLVAILAGRLHAEFARVRILYEEILEKMAEGLVAIDSSGRIIFVNGEARQILNDWRGDPLAGRLVRDVFRRTEDRAFLHCLDSPEPIQVELEVDMRGRRKAVEVKTSVLRDEKGCVRGTIGIFNDLTLKRQAEALEKRALRLEEIEQIALGIAHEVRNPLASIRGCVQELGRLPALGPDERELAEIVVRESDRLDRIVGEFMRFARMRPPVIGDMDLAALLSQVVLLLRGRASGPAPAAAATIETDLPAEARVRADAEALTQVFLNLGINALDALPATGGRLRIACAPARRALRREEGPQGGAERRRILTEAAGFEVTFIDDGHGIPPDDLKRIFAPFFTTKKGGTGLGLAVADRIVKAHGGSISVESARGEGTTFTVFVPTTGAPAAATPAPAAPALALLPAAPASAAPALALAPPPPAPATVSAREEVIRVPTPGR